MPGYEVVLIARALKKADVVSAVGRIGKFMLSNGAIIRKLEFMGERELPLKMRRHNRDNLFGNYFLFHIDAPPSIVSTVAHEVGRDVDMVRVSLITSANFPLAPSECTLHDEMKIPMERPSVQRLMEIGRKPEKPKFTHNVKGVV